MRQFSGVIVWGEVRDLPRRPQLTDAVLRLRRIPIGRYLHQQIVRDLTQPIELARTYHRFRRCADDRWLGPDIPVQYLPVH